MKKLTLIATTVLGLGLLAGCQPRLFDAPLPGNPNPPHSGPIDPGLPRDPGEEDLTCPPDQQITIFRPVGVPPLGGPEILHFCPLP